MLCITASLYSYVLADELFDALFLAVAEQCTQLLSFAHTSRGTRAIRALAVSRTGVLGISIIARVVRASALLVVALFFDLIARKD